MLPFPMMVKYTAGLIASVAWFIKDPGLAPAFMFVVALLSTVLLVDEEIRSRARATALEQSSDNSSD